MRSPEIERKFNEHIDARLASRNWSAEIARSVIARDRLDRKNKRADIAALVFPLAAAAVLILALLPFDSIPWGKTTTPALTSQSTGDGQYLTAAQAATDFDGIAGYYPDF